MGELEDFATAYCRARRQPEQPSLLAQLAAIFEQAREPYPSFRLSPAEFASYVAERVSPDELEVLRAADLYLAAGCAYGRDEAVAEVDRALMPWLTAALSKVVSAADADDVSAKLRADLFVRDGEREPKIASYRGVGELRGWLRVTATRDALKQKRRLQRNTSLDEIAEQEATGMLGEQPELGVLKATYRPLFQRAFADALSALPDRDRTLLRQSALDGLSIDALAKIYDVHRATAARWLAKVRSDLLRDTKRRLAEEAKLSLDECESIIRLVQSQLDITIRSRLAEAG